MPAPPAISAVQWRERAAALKPRGQVFIDGRFVAAANGATFDNINPATGRSLGVIAAGEQLDIDRAVDSSRAAFRRGSWAQQPPKARKKVLLKLAELMLANREELALLETLDMGKPISDSLNVDIPSAANCIRWYGEAVDKIYDEVAPTGPNALATITREPMGVVGAIVPWNFPLLMACWKIGPVLASGNSLVLKPSEKSPLTALRLAEIAMEAGLPEGVFNVVPGFGQTAGKALASSMGVDCIAFTGSTATGKMVMQYAAQSNLKKVSLECGGKSPNIVLADCPDLDKAATAAAYAIFFNQGEMCSAGSRLLVEASIKDAMLEKIAVVGRQMKPGDPLDPATKLGAIVDETQMRRVLSYIDAGKTDGAKVALGGNRVREESGGFFVEPTVFDGVLPAMRIAREEIFGPVLATISFKNVDEAIQIANDVEYGLAAAVWTRDINVAHRTARALRAGTVYVNCYDADDITVPFGGFKQSGIGRDKSLHAFDKYTELKTTWIELYLDINPDSPVAFVDIETTGCAPGTHRVIDVAVIGVTGSTVDFEWQSLVNPGVHVPAGITALTGIDNDMLGSAPSFERIARELRERLEGRVFVAHNVRFDYGFIRREFAALGDSWCSPNLCTVRLSRALYPDMPRHNLDAVMERHGIVIENRHRAMPDAQALLAFWRKVRAVWPRELLQSALDLASHRATLPAALPPDLPDELPEGPGVYRFFGVDESGAETLLYVASANILRERVLDHFRGGAGDTKAAKLAAQVRRVEWTETAGELGALLLEAREVRETQPLYNRQARSSEERLTWQFDDGDAAPQLVTLTAQVLRSGNAFGTYRTARDARRALEGLAREHQWCFKLLGLESGAGSCFGLQVGRCKGACVGKEPAPLHMARVKIGLLPLKLKPWPHEGPMVLREGAGERQQWHIIDAWQHLATIDASDEDAVAEICGRTRRPTDRFDIDAYRIFTRYLRDSRHKPLPLPRLPAGI